MTSSAPASAPVGVVRGWLALAAAAAALLLVAFVWAPATAFLYNATEVTIPLRDVLAAAWPWPLVAALALVGLGAVVGRRRRPNLALGVVALAALLHLQGNLLVGRYGNFAGQDIDWSAHRALGLAEAALWLGLPVLVVLARRRLLRHVPALALAVAAAGGLTLAVQARSGGSFTPATPTEIDDRLYDFSAEQNVLLIILDAFAAPAFDRMLAQDPAWRDRLDGFTWYRDALAAYPTTLPSVPTLLSGRTTDNSVPVKTYLTEALGASLPVVLQRRGLASHVLTEPIFGEYLPGIAAGSHLAFLDAEPGARRQRDAVRIWNVALFRYLPQGLKRQVYRDQRWLLRAPSGPVPGDEPGLPYELDEPYRVPSPGQQASWLVWRRMLDHARVGSHRPTFKLLHFFTTHTPYFVDAECRQLTREAYAHTPKPDLVVAQSTCALDQVLALLDRLDTLGVLDRTLVVLAGDHGSHIDLDPGRGDWSELPAPSLVRPLLLVKPVGAHGTLAVSDAPVGLADIPATVAAAVGAADAFPGPALGDIPADVARPRTYYDYTWEHLYWWEEYLPPLTAYKVDGPVDDAGSWTRQDP